MRTSQRKTRTPEPHTTKRVPFSCFTHEEVLTTTRASAEVYTRRSGTSGNLLPCAESDPASRAPGTLLYRPKERIGADCQCGSDAFGFSRVMACFPSHSVRGS